jgi:hypothetical protein
MESCRVRRGNLLSHDKGWYHDIKCIYKKPEFHSPSLEDWATACTWEFNEHRAAYWIGSHDGVRPEAVTFLPSSLDTPDGNHGRAWTI